MMRTSYLWCGLAAALAVAGCDPGPDPVPAIGFAMFAPGQYDTSEFDAAWTAARADPTAGVAYEFPLTTVDIEPGTQVRLVVGRSTSGSGYPETTGDDVIIADPMQVATSAVDADGGVAFPPLAVVTGGWTSDTATIPAELLCGVTVIAARAYMQGDGDPPAYALLAATWLVAVATPCD